MAQGAVAFLSANAATLTPDELHEIRECQKICAFRDAVLAGTHPRIKVPSHPVNVSKLSSAGHISGATTPAAHTHVASSSNTETPSLFSRTKNATAQQNSTLPIKPTKSEINPILLEKSEDLIKAEIQLQRQRLERALREQIEQQRLAQKAAYQSSESLPNFDLTEVLTKALAIVHPSAIVEAAPSVGAASDSFDDNTFYSSQHDTPNLSSSPHGKDQKESGEVQSHAVLSADESSGTGSASQSRANNRETVATGNSRSNDNVETAQHFSSSHQLTHNIHTTDNSSMVNARNNIADVYTIPDESSHVLELRDTQKSTNALLKEAFAIDSTSPLVRGHDLSPVAPQPARVSPLALAREPPIAHQLHPDEAPPAQVAALREKISENSSTDSSPKGSRSERKKRKEKKQKRKSAVVNTPDSPYIKPEPRSPSPYGVTPLPRPNKRPRVSAYGTELNYDEPRHDEPSASHGERTVARREIVPYESYGESRRVPPPTYERVGRDEDNYRRRVSEGQYIRRLSPQAPQGHDLYGQPEATSARAVSHAVVDRRIDEPPRYYRDLPPRASVRPDVDRDRSRSPIMRERASPIPMGPPRHPVRIIVDEYGREYIDPTPVRPAMAPPARREIYYERAPTRAVSSRAPVETFEENGVLYRRASPIAMAPRRVVTQPEYSDPEYRQYRQREYSVRPMGPPSEEFVRQREYSVRPSMAPPADDYLRQREYSVRPMAPPGEEYIPIRAPIRREATYLEEVPPREYIRAPSVRPETVRYELPREYVGRLQSVRPEVPGREYTGSVRPEALREVAIPPQREYSVRPVERPRREYIMDAGDRYYEGGREAERVTYMERPAPEAGDVVYAGDGIRREVYRS
ncbi:hypothetical protein BP6252_04261 [Coleophoma cylindrospora]|uniref:Uncharacterized protein n=1 Tax=Coleophoma cylindrospora TaxID=1849047 RepID=A0A3D8RZZ5_9HELO|nr:hypothetical protein BP6252_04261 [Coleophoma cylindrospora]